MMLLSETLTKDYLSKLDSIQAVINQRISAGNMGARKASGKGNSLEFSDFRRYTFGDDIRRIDWNSYARFDKFFVKTYNEEKQATANIFLDTSKSMDFGEGLQNKGYYTKVVAASVAYMFMRNADVVNIYSCGEKLSVERQKLSSRGRFHELVDLLDKLVYNEKTNLTKAITAAGNVRLGSGVSIVLSDFFSDDGYQDALKMLQSKNQQVTVVQVLSADEVNPPKEGKLRLVDSESENIKDIAINADAIERYFEALKSFKSEIKSFCDKRGFGYFFADTSVHSLEIISKLFI